MDRTDPDPPDGSLAGWPSGPSLLAAIVEGSHDAILAKDMDGVITAWNPAAERIYGYSSDEVVGRRVSVLIPDDLEDELAEIMARLRRGERIEQYETERITREGRRLHVSLTISPIRDEDGELVGASAIARDITAQRRARARRAFVTEVSDVLSTVLEGEEVLRRLARLAVREMADYCVAYLVEHDHEIRRVGAAHADPAQEELLHRLLDIRAPRMDDEMGAGAVIRTGEPILAEEIPEGMLEKAAPDPDYLDVLRELGPISSMVLPLRARGRAVGAVTFANTALSGARYGREDLDFATELANRAALALDNARLLEESRTEVALRRAAEETLRRRYEQLRIVYQMTDAVGRAGELDDIYQEALSALKAGVGADRASILLFGTDGVLRFEAWSGLSEGYRAAVEGHTPWSPDTPDPSPILVPDVASDADLDDELRETILSEGIRALAFIPLAFGGRLLGKFMVYFDVPHEMATEELELSRTIASTIAFAIRRVKDEQSVRSAKEAAERANQAKSQFLGVMSHELRTPLNSVGGYADLLLEEVKGPLNGEQRDYVRRIKASAEHQLRLVEELLTYTRLEVGREDLRLVPTDVRRIVIDVAELIRPEADRKELTLLCQVPQEGLETVTDPARLRQIVLNLAANAAKFTTRGEIALRARGDDDGMVIVVSDTGPGIPEEELERIWEPFSQVQQDGGGPSGGTGLGLAIARRFATLLGGELAVASEVGRGTTFTLRLPRASEAPEPVQTAETA